MKKILPILSLFFLITACNNNHLGDWVLYKSNEKGIYSEPPKIKILKDSIKFQPWNYNSWDKYSYTLEDSKLNINETEIDFRIEKDTLILNESIKYIKVESKRAIELYRETNSDIKINLPKIEGAKLIEYSKPKYGTYIRYGRRYDNGEFSLQLNDRYMGMEYLSEFVVDERDYNQQNYERQKHYLFCDKDTKMKDLEIIFINMANVNEGEILLVNNEELIFNDSLAFNYKVQGLRIRINYTDYMSKYARKKSKINREFIPVFNTPIMYPSLYNSSQEDSNVISLVKNEIFFNRNKIKKEDLSELLKEDIEKQNSVIVLYDLESDYYHFLELHLVIRKAYNTIRERKSLVMHNKLLNDLSKEELQSVKREVPIRTLINYSIPHFKSIVIKNRYFLDGKVKCLDSILPMM